MSEIPIQSVKPGMILEEAIYHSTNKKLMLAAGATLSESNITLLARLGLRTLKIVDQYTRFIKPYDKVKHYLKSIYAKYIDIYASEKPEENLCDEMIYATKIMKEIVNEICNKEKVLNLCMQMHIQSTDALFEHSVLTSVFSGLLAGAMSREIELSIDTMKNIVLGGLLHNIGILEMSYLIPYKDSLKGQQELLWKEHPMYGYYLSIQEDFSREISSIIMTHEERWDGSGYPGHLIGEEIPIEARIVSVCSSITDFMIFRNQQPYEAIEYLYGTSNIYFDKRVVDAFATNVTLYPLGTLVRLTTGEVGVVSNIRRNRGPRPVVNVYFNRFNKPYSSPKMVDLGVERTIFISQILAF